METGWLGYCDLFLDKILASPDAALRARLAQLAVAADPFVAAQSWQSLMRFDARPDLNKVRIPALTIHGGQSGLYPVEVAQEIAKRMGDCRPIIIKHAGHAPQLEASEEVNAHVRALARVTRPSSPLHQPLSAP
jgi:pimeloyl-ACP methyl ester carboxylesterase